MYKDEALYLLKGGKEGILQWNRKVTAGKANLDLCGCKLPAAKLMGVRLVGANLRQADLSWAELAGADLSGADEPGKSRRRKLHNAILIKADLSLTHFRQADLCRRRSQRGRPESGHPPRGLAGPG